MERHIRTLADSFAAVCFAVTALLTALRSAAPGTSPDWEFMESQMTPFAPGPGPGSAGGDLLGAVSQPTNPVLWALLAAVILAVALHVLVRVRRPVSAPRDLARTAGLLLGAIWPWILVPVPLAGLILAAGSCALLAAGVVPSPGSPPRTGREALADLPIAFVAGWMLMAATSALGMYVHHRLGIPLERSVLIGLLPAALLGAWGQLRMEGAVTFSLALIWAMIGFAAATAGASITVATACVLGIAALAVVLVRVTT